MLFKILTITLNLENKTLRISTAQKRRELEIRQQEREVQNKLKSKKPGLNSVNTNDLSEYRRLTQEELLAEAKITEKLNLASLG
jgi:vacuolar protein sorting-associated protein 72